MALEELNAGVLMSPQDRTERAYLRIAEACEQIAEACERTAAMFEQVFAGTVADDIEEGDEPEPVTSWNSGKG